MAGLAIELSTNPKGEKESKPVLIHVTNEDGVTAFTAVKPGSYFVGIKHVAFSYSEEIVVKSRSSKNARDKVAFDWPGETLSVQSMSGLLNAPIRTDNPLKDQAHPVFAPFGEAKMSLSRAVSGEIIESQTASESGAFNFHWITAGLYLLHIEMPENANDRYRSGNGYVPIEINASAKALNLNLFLFPGLCGSLGYENREGAAAQ